MKFFPVQSDMNLMCWFSPCSKGFFIYLTSPSYNRYIKIFLGSLGFHPPQNPTLQIYSNSTRIEDPCANQLFKADVASSLNIMLRSFFFESIQSYGLHNHLYYVHLESFRNKTNNLKLHSLYLCQTFFTNE